jgi:hypothetical protein
VDAPQRKTDGTANGEDPAFCTAAAALSIEQLREEMEADEAEANLLLQDVEAGGEAPTQLRNEIDDDAWLGNWLELAPAAPPLPALIEKPETMWTNTEVAVLVSAILLLMIIVLPVLRQPSHGVSKPEKLGQSDVDAHDDVHDEEQANGVEVGDVAVERAIELESHGAEAMGQKPDPRIPSDQLSLKEMIALPVRELRQRCAAAGLQTDSMCEKSEMAEALMFALSGALVPI